MAQHTTGDVFDIGFGERPTGRPRLEYDYTADEEGTGRAYAALTVWPATEDEVRVIFHSTPPLPASYPYRRHDRPCGWQDRMASVYATIDDLGWILTKRERRLLERITAEWAPELSAAA